VRGEAAVGTLLKNKAGGKEKGRNINMKERGGLLRTEKKLPKKVKLHKKSKGKPSRSKELISSSTPFKTGLGETIDLGSSKSEFPNKKGGKLPLL